MRYDEQFFTEDSRYTKEELLAILDKAPSRITPAAGLRPITQDSILPTLATVVGPGELKYFAQLKGVYDFHEIAMPYIHPRMSATILEPPVKRILEKFELTYEAFVKDPDGIKESILLDLSGLGQAFEKTTEALNKQLSELTEHIRDIDPSLERTVLRAEGYFEKTLEVLRTKTAKALVREDAIYTRQLKRLEAHLLPLGTPQERLLSPFSFFLKFGVDYVTEQFLNLPAKGTQVLEF